MLAHVPQSPVAFLLVTQLDTPLTVLSAILTKPSSFPSSGHFSHSRLCGYTLDIISKLNAEYHILDCGLMSHLPFEQGVSNVGKKSEQGLHQSANKFSNGVATPKPKAFFQQLRLRVINI